MREQTPEERTQQWRLWANFVFLAGGTVPDLDDLHLQLRVVQAYDAEIATLRAEQTRLRAENKQLRVGLFDADERDALKAEQTRLREALEAVKDYWARYGFSGWKGDDDFDRLSNQIDAALSSTPTPETTP